MERGKLRRFHMPLVGLLVWLAVIGFASSPGLAASKISIVYSAKVISQSPVWIAIEQGFFEKRGLDVRLTYIGGAPPVVATLLAGGADVALIGGVGIIRAYLGGARNLVFIGALKNVLTGSIVGKPELRTVPDLKGKKIGVVRVGSNPHFLAVEILKRFNLDAGRDVSFIQTGGQLESVAAMASGAVDAIAVIPPQDTQVIQKGFRLIADGTALRIPYAATALATTRDTIAKRQDILQGFVDAIREAAQFLFTRKEVAMGIIAKNTQIRDVKTLELAYNAEVPVLERDFRVDLQGIAAVLESAKSDFPQAPAARPEDLVDTRFLK
ncbi:MAG: ABC transporter substrate-binding protein [Candidatus Tectomicrobia bacterium]|uniref:ABC transporter substrate-binding protein n=1 Tax=Tectimicrobiota bacterium TaxID=2528274 RepID=A0A932GS68_UNCTE|nr:ABC transporter substrate-binding protein [Candidatus Tectomicrobia bacterium]